MVNGEKTTAAVGYGFKSSASCDENARARNARDTIADAIVEIVEFCDDADLVQQLTSALWNYRTCYPRSRNNMKSRFAAELLDALEETVFDPETLDN